MEEIKFVYGDEKRFLEFVSGMKGEKTALVSHTDLDGLVAGRVVNEAVNADFIRFVNYADLNDKLVLELKDSKAKRVILTDLMMKERSFVSAIEKFSKVLIIDHHLPDVDYNSDRTLYMNSQGNCASYLSYHLFSKVADLKKLDWLVACACIADFLYFNNKEFMESTYKKYGDKFAFKEGFVNPEGKFWDMQYDLSASIIYHGKNLREFFDKIPLDFGKLGELEKGVQEVRKDVENSKKNFDKEKEIIGDIYFWEVKSKYAVKAMIVNDLSKKILDKTLLFAREEGKNYYLSARRQDGKVDMNYFLLNLTKGFKDSNAGGHFKAGGGQILLKDKEKFLERLRKAKK